MLLTIEDMRSMPKEQAYDRLCDMADFVLKVHNPCQIRCGSCIAGSFCCHGCENLGPNGCTTRSLTCKLYLCNQPPGSYIRNTIEAIRSMAKQLGFYSVFRGTKAQHLESANATLSS